MLRSYSTIILAASMQFQASTITALLLPEEHSPGTSNGQLLERDTSTILFQNTENDEMKFICQPLGTKLSQLTDYTFLSGAGSGVTVYVHDSGINLKHEEFTTPFPGIQKGTIGQLWPGTSAFDPEPVEDEAGHGTCVADKIIGHKFGLAKGANLLMVPWIDKKHSKWMKAGLQTIIKHIKEKRAKNPDYLAVVNFSYRLGREPSWTPATIRSFRILYKEIYDLDAVMVFAAGNNGDREKTSETKVNFYPALFAEEFPNMIVVGAVNVNGLPTRSTEGGPLVHISAPGELTAGIGIQCAQGTGTSGIHRKRGTSVSAPQVAALAAYLLSVEPRLRKTGSVAQRVKARILKLGYIREVGRKHDSYTPAIWNGLQGTLKTT